MDRAGATGRQRGETAPTLSGGTIWRALCFWRRYMSTTTAIVIPDRTRAASLSKTMRSLVECAIIAIAHAPTAARVTRDLWDQAACQATAAIKPVRRGCRISSAGRPGCQPSGLSAYSTPSITPKAHEQTSTRR